MVFGYNELGMHCMNEDFPELAILPPFNTLRAALVRRGFEPDIITTRSRHTAGLHRFSLNRLTVERALDLCNLPDAVEMNIR